MKKYVISDGEWYMVSPKLIPDFPNKANDFFTRDERLAFEFNNEMEANLFFQVSMPLMSPLLVQLGANVDNFFVLEIEED